jgi:bifunctional oligoribonuclease and PAP phosphatase NrnA
MTNKLNWSAAIEAVNAASTILIVTHVSPDGDAIGSLLGLTHALHTRGKTVTPVVDEGVPDYLKYIPGSDLVLPKVTIGKYDLMICTDASDELRTGDSGLYGRTHSTKVINLDHHATNTLFGDIHLVMPEAVSATEIVYHLLRKMEQSFTREIAVPLLTGLVTDTIGFRVSSVTAETLAIAQVLMQAGASLTEITQRTLDNKSYTTINLWKNALQSVTLQGTVIYATVSQEDLRRAGLEETTDAGLVGFLNTVSEAMIACVFKENADGTIELSFRSKPGFDVGTTAFTLGGGGHKQASGATVTGTLAEVQARVLPMLQEAAAQGKLVIA